MSDLPSDLTPFELAKHMRAKIAAANAYTRMRKQIFRRKSVAVRITILVLSAASTIILGLQNLDPWTGTAFSLIAVVTVVSALEPFFAWRSLWVLMEEASYRFHRLADELEYYLAENPPDEVDGRRVREMFDEYQEIWEKLSTRWMNFREIGDR